MNTVKKIFLFIFFMVLATPTGLYAETIKIGVSLGLTGSYAVEAEIQKRGFLLWQKHVNERGGLLGKKVSVIIADDHSDPKRAVDLYEDFIMNKRVDFLFGPYSTRITEAVLPVTERYNFPLLITGASGDILWEKGYRHAIGVFTPGSKFTSGFLEILLKAGIKNVAILNANDSFSKNLARYTSQGLVRYGLKEVFRLEYDKQSVDFKDILKKVRKTNAEALILCDYLEGAVSMRLAMKEIKWRPKVFYASVGAAIPEFYKRLKELANGVFSTSLWEYKSGFPGNNEFYRDYLKLYGEEPSYHAAIAYAGGQVLENVVTKTNSFDRTRITDELYKLDSMTIIGRFGIDKTGKQIRHSMFIVQWQKGVKQIVWPYNLATANPIIK